MGSLICPDLTLDSRFSLKSCVRRPIGEFIAQSPEIRSQSDKILKLHDIINRLQDEMKKIEAFKRELPLCMLLLSDAIVVVKEELGMKSNSEPVLEEFMPLKKVKEKDVSSRDNTRNLLSCVQLRNSNDNNCSPKSDNGKSLSLKLNNDKSGGNRFPVMTIRKEDKDELPVPELSLSTPEMKNLREENHSISLNLKSSPNGQLSFVGARKQRRCWSPELHRRFVGALQQLGGPQAATPKQIRELMQVDGLTNDEVKSHLQKYRLHTRRVTTNPSSAQPSSSWMSQEQCLEPSKQRISPTGSPQGPLQLAISTHGNSAGDDSIEGENDEKSESHRWKSHIRLSRSENV